MVFATLFFCVSLTPSLLPRDWLNGGIVGGITAAIGYGLGVLIGAMARRLLARRLLARRSWLPPQPRLRRGLKPAVAALSLSASALMVLPAAAWQREIAAVMGIEGNRSSQPKKSGGGMFDPFDSAVRHGDAATQSG
jgi:uncharacterized membrane protein